MLPASQSQAESALTLDELNFKILISTIWATFRGLGIALLGAMGSYMNGTNGLLITLTCTFIFTGILFLAATALEYRLSKFYTFIVLSLILEVGLLSGWIIHYFLN
ncbi:MAG: hypothetical protein QNJ49_00405 [Mastigocoleus sp. MO_167.B18]|uniref:hypothetical protein n=1 Tax=Mastigocoleus sp. MO_188.B34 TaxID=3036635 RepID=UPI00262F19D0|nr:hypothetical protein [Mastigocoleus sp. MO_188.B34]MDJ0692913.1 hypothetical protein [Mastigocoleus sp. MO_188.B34]MDJ0771880.1 hypothetical protein [Mastigocoleus sp. MO_167.B18]